jgi:hypothetical protein
LLGRDGVPSWLSIDAKKNRRPWRTAIRNVGSREIDSRLPIFGCPTPQSRNLGELKAFSSQPTGKRRPGASGREKAKNSVEKPFRSRCRKGAKGRNAIAKRLQNREEQIIGTRDKSQCLVAQRLLSHLQYPDAAKSSIKDLSLPPFNLKSS